MTDKHSRSNREKSQNIERGKWGCPVGYMIMKKARRRDKQSSSTTTQGVDYLPVINKLGRSNGKGKKKENQMIRPKWEEVHPAT